LAWASTNLMCAILCIGNCPTLPSRITSRLEGTLKSQKCNYNVNDLDLRAGRDGLPSECLLYYHYADVLTNQQIQKGRGTSERDLRNILRYCRNNFVCRHVQIGVRKSLTNLRTKLRLANESHNRYCSGKRDWSPATQCAMFVFAPAVFHHSSTWTTRYLQRTFASLVSPSRHKALETIKFRLTLR
jgi:superfamily II DNA helicase RecQ